MNLLARFEKVAEKLFTGAFKKTTARLQPVEIAKELVKVMLEHKQVSVTQVYVPNIFRVFLHPNDWGPLASFGEAFLIEVAKYIYAEGQRQGYTFLTKPVVEIFADDQVEACQMIIEVDFDDLIVVEWQNDLEETQDEQEWREQTNIHREAVETNRGYAKEDGRNPEYYLEVIEGKNLGKRFPLEEGAVCLGRHSQCEIVLTDPEISRRHLKLTVEEAGWFLDDLGSMNGTWVNGQRVMRQTVAPGDKIQIGQTVLQVRRAVLKDIG